MGNENSGRKPKGMLRAEADQSLFESLKGATHLIKDIANGKRKTPDSVVMDNAWRIIYQVMGKPIGRHIIAGDPDNPLMMGWTELVKLLSGNKTIDAAYQIEEADTSEENTGEDSEKSP